MTIKTGFWMAATCISVCAPPAVEEKDNAESVGGLLCHDSCPRGSSLSSFRSPSHSHNCPFLWIWIHTLLLTQGELSVLWWDSKTAVIKLSWKWILYIFIINRYCVCVCVCGIAILKYFLWNSRKLNQNRRQYTILFKLFNLYNIDNSDF